MKLPAQPSPTTKRATARPAPDSATECSSAPATISTDSAETVMRGPILSNRTPTKICGSSSARKKLPLANPSASGESDRSRISSGAMTDVEARKNCDRMVVAASIVSRTAAAFHATGCAGAAAWADCAGGFSFTATALPLDYPRQVPAPVQNLALARLRRAPQFFRCRWSQGMPGTPAIRDNAVCGVRDVASKDRYDPTDPQAASVGERLSDGDDGAGGHPAAGRGAQKVPARDRRVLLPADAARGGGPAISRFRCARRRADRSAARCRACPCSPGASAPVNRPASIR